MDRLLTTLLMTAFLIQSVSSKPTENYNNKDIKNCIVAWNKGNKNFDAQKPTLVFATNASHCSSCCVAAANTVSSRIKKPMNMLFVVAVEEAGESSVSKVTGYYAVEDLKNNLKSIFKTNINTPELFVIDKDGNVVYNNKDIQHGVEKFEAEFNEVAIKFLKKILTKKIPLEEDEDAKIKDIYSPIMNTDKHIFTFIEPQKNRILSYDINNGKMTSVIEIDDSLGWYFYKNPLIVRTQTDSLAWAGFQSYPITPSALAIVKNSVDTMEVLFNGFVSYLYNFRQPGDNPADSNRIMWGSENFIYPYIQGKWGKPYRVSEGRNYLAKRNEDLTSEKYDFAYSVACIHPNGFIGECKKRGSKNRDSMYLMGLYSRPNKLKNIIPLSELGTLAKEIGNESQIAFSVTPSTGTVFVLNAQENYFSRYDAVGDDFKGVKIDPQGVLKILFDNKKGMKLDLLDMFSNEGGTYVTMSYTSENEKDNFMILQRYSPTTNILNSEGRIDTDISDKLLTSRIIGVNKSELQLATKYKKNRWRIEKIKLDDLLK